MQHYEPHPRALRMQLQQKQFTFQPKENKSRLHEALILPFCIIHGIQRPNDRSKITKPREGKGKFGNISTPLLLRVITRQAKNKCMSKTEKVPSSKTLQNLKSAATWS